VRGIHWQWEIPKEGKIYLFKSYYVPILTYGAETCTWTKASISRLMAREMRFIRKNQKGQNKEQKKLRKFRHKHLGRQIRK
jgi:hypothetical protein